MIRLIFYCFLTLCALIKLPCGRAAAAQGAALQSENVFIASGSQPVAPGAPRVVTAGDTICNVSTARNFALALSTPSGCEVVTLVEDIVLTDADFVGLAPIAVNYNVTLRGSGPRTVLDLNGVYGKIQLGNGFSLTLKDLVIDNFDLWSGNLAPGFQLLLDMRPGEAGVVQAEGCLLLPTICLDQGFMIFTAYLSPRPAMRPGDQVVVGCNNATLLERGRQREGFAACIAAVDYCIDAGRLGANGAVTPIGYIGCFRSTILLCYGALSFSCMEAYGPLGCLLVTTLRSPGPGPPASVSGPSDGSPALPPVGSAPGGAGGGGSSSTPAGAIAGGVVGGILVLAALALLGVFLARRRRRGAAPPGGSGAPSSERESPGPLWRMSARKTPTGVSASASGSGSLPVAALGTAPATTASQSTTKHSGGLPAEQSTGCCQSPATSLFSNTDGGTSLRKAHTGLTTGSENTVITRRTPMTSGLELGVRLAQQGELQEQEPGQQQGEQEAVRSPAHQEDHSEAQQQQQQPLERAGGAVSGAEVQRPSRSSANAHSSKAHGDAEVKLLAETLGRGCFGAVHKGTYKGQLVAVKVVAEVHGSDRAMEQLQASFAQEVEVLGRCRHPNVVRLLAACLTPPKLCLVMEIMDTSLAWLLYKSGTTPLPLEKVLHIGLEVARGLDYLHPTIVHRDLKPANVLLNNALDPRPVVKLADFGLSRLRSTMAAETQTPEAGTPAYLAPESYDPSNTIISNKVDIYALGVLLWEMVAGVLPWHGYTNVGIGVAIFLHQRRLPLSSLSPGRCPLRLQRLLCGMWEQDPLRRPSADEVAKGLMLLLQEVRSGVALGGMTTTTTGTSSATATEHSPGADQPGAGGSLAGVGPTAAAAAALAAEPPDTAEAGASGDAVYLEPIRMSCGGSCGLEQSSAGAPPRVAPRGGARDAPDPHPHAESLHVKQFDADEAASDDGTLDLLLAAQRSSEAPALREAEARARAGGSSVMGAAAVRARGGGSTPAPLEAAARARAGGAPAVQPIGASAASAYRTVEAEEIPGKP